MGHQYLTFTVGHSIEQELETDRRAVTLFGKQAYCTNHVAADTVTGNCEMCRTDIEPVNIVRDVFGDFVGSLERKRVIALLQPMIVDEYDDHARTVRDVLNEPLMHFEQTHGL